MHFVANKQETLCWGRLGIFHSGLANASGLGLRSTSGVRWSGRAGRTVQNDRPDQLSGSRCWTMLTNKECESPLRATQSPLAVMCSAAL